MKKYIWRKELKVSEEKNKDDNLLKVWRNLSKSDKEYLLGHTSDFLTDFDRAKLAQIVNSEGDKLRKSLSPKITKNFKRKKK